MIDGDVITLTFNPKNYRLLIEGVDNRLEMAISKLESGPLTFCAWLDLSEVEILWILNDLNISHIYI